MYRPKGPNQTAQSVAVPPPVGGWNTRDALDAMQPNDAVQLVNWFPRESDVITRKGYSSHCDTGEGTVIQTLVEYKSGSASKLIAGVNGKLVNVTTSSPSTLGTGYSSNIWDTANFRGKIHLVNGADAPKLWDGSTLSSPSWTGPTIANLNGVMVFKSRLFFMESNSQSFWYGGVNSESGALTEFPLSAAGNFGGKLKAMGTLTQDGGDGVNDLAVFFMSSGEVIVYNGSDPGDATAWSLVGVFRIGSLVANNAVQKVGSDLICITTDGFVPLTRFFQFGRGLSDKQALSDKISKAASQAVSSYGNNNGWDILLYPKSDMLIFNVPRTALAFDQYVMNTKTLAWCRFRDQPAHSWSLLNDHAYFGGTDGVVYKADDGDSDNGTAITSDAQVAWNYFGNRAQQKRFTGLRPVFQAPNEPTISLNLGVDFQSQVPTNQLTVPSFASSATWDVDTWDNAIWGGAVKTVRGWQSVTGIGYAASLRLRLSSDSQQVEWLSSNYAFEPGGIL